MALLNVTGTGAGYLALRRWRLWLAHALLAAGVALAAVAADASRTPAAWMGVFGAVLAWTAAHGWWVARRVLQSRRVAGRPVRLGRSWPALAGSALLLVAVVAAVWLYRDAGERALAAGLRAERAGDCAKAVGHYRQVTGVYELTLARGVARADQGLAACGAFLEAERHAEVGDPGGAAAAFEDYLGEYPAGPLVPAARDRLARSLYAVAVGLDAEGRHLRAVQTFQEIRERLGDTGTAARIAPAEAVAHLGLARDLEEQGDLALAVGEYGAVLERFGSTSSADAAAAELDALYASALAPIGADQGCDARETLEGFRAAGLRQDRATKALPAALLACGRERLAQGDHGLAIQSFQGLIQEHPRHRLALAAREGLVDARVAEAVEGLRPKLRRFEATASAPGGIVEVRFRNDSPVRHEVLLSGPSSRSVVLGPCRDCARHPRKAPKFCPGKGPERVVRLEPGRYQVVFLPLGDDTVATAWGRWQLRASKEYEGCILVG